MKKSLLLVMLLACISFMGNSISAQGQMVGSAHYKAGSGDFHFNNNNMPCEVYGFTDVSPIVSNIGFGSKWLRFSIQEEFMETIAYMARNLGYYDIVVLCRYTWWGGDRGYIRLYIN